MQWDYNKKKNISILKKDFMEIGSCRKTVALPENVLRVEDMDGITD